MPFPNIHACIICEEVREEKRKLLSILGFYGAAPEVEILVRDFSESIRLSLLFLASEGRGQYKVAPLILDPDGGVVLDSPAMDANIPEPSKRYVFGFGFAALRLPRAGRYTIVLRVDGQTHYQTTFDVRQGNPGDFA